MFVLDTSLTFSSTNDRQKTPALTLHLQK